MDVETATWLRQSDDGFTLDVHAVPGARRSEAAGTHGGALRIRLAAPPVDGKANTELIRFLAEVLGIPRSNVTIEAGHRGRRKRVRVSDVSAGVAARALAALQRFGEHDAT